MGKSSSSAGGLGAGGQLYRALTDDRVADPGGGTETAR